MVRSQLPCAYEFDNFIVESSYKKLSFTFNFWNTEIERNLTKYLSSYKSFFYTCRSKILFTKLRIQDMKSNSTLFLYLDMREKISFWRNTGVILLLLSTNKIRFQSFVWIFLLQWYSSVAVLSQKTNSLTAPFWIPLSLISGYVMDAGASNVD